MTQSNEPTIPEMNLVLAVFDGWLLNKNGTVSSLNSIDKFENRPLQLTTAVLQYHNSWDWLMPVLAKIKSIANALDMPREFISRWKPIENELRNINIINTHYCVYKFIQWYNQQKQKDGEG